MASTFTTNIALEKQATGENDNTWGTLLNAVLDIVDKVLTEQLSLSVAGSSDVTLTSTQYENFYQKYTGTLTGNINVIVPATNRFYAVENATSGAFTLTVKTPSGSGIAVTQGEKWLLYCDGTNVIEMVTLLRNVSEDTTPQLGGPLDTNSQAIDFSEGAAVASASQPDIFGGQDGNTVHITGTTTITDFVDAPRIGASRWLVFDGALTLTHGSGITIQGEANITTAAGDVAFVYADAVDAFRLIYFPISGYIKTGEGSPVGTVNAYAGTSAPTGWLLCYGQEVSRTTYADLFAVVSTTYGVGDGSTTFNLPDLRGRVVAGQDDMGGVSANRLTNQSGGVDGDVLGDTGGAETHQLTEAELAQHEHAQGSSLAAATGDTAPVNFQQTNNSGAAGELVGSGTAHNNVQPTIILNYIIKT